MSTRPETPALEPVTLPCGSGRVQYGGRYAVIVRSDDLLALSTVVICPA
jgi:mRNA-degrading endonuclease toxin of MazEF toxin-antitoxin module